MFYVFPKSILFAINVYDDFDFKPPPPIIVTYFKQRTESTMLDVREPPLSAQSSGGPIPAAGNAFAAAVAAIAALSGGGGAAAAEAAEAVREAEADAADDGPLVELEYWRRRMGAVLQVRVGGGDLFFIFIFVLLGIYNHFVMVEYWQWRMGAVLQMSFVRSFVR